MKVTIKDIARETGLSATTVSIVLNNKPYRLSEETRKNVWDVAKRLGYRKNRIAAGLRTQKTKTIGMVVPDFTNAYFCELVKGAEEKCIQEGYALILCSSSNKEDYINLLIDRAIDGIIFSVDGIDQEKRKILIDHILSFGISVVILESEVQSGEFFSVFCDNYHGGYLATRHLLDLGHTKIGCIKGAIKKGCEESLSSRINLRFHGYKAALEEAGIPFCEDYVMEGNHTISSGEICAPNLVSKGVTGIVASNDLCAFGIYKWAQNNHVIIPDDLSVVGYDDIVYSDFFTPRLTTIRQPTYNMGAAAAKKIIEYCEGADNTKKENIIFTPELIVRESTCRIS